MSIASEITRLQGVKADILQAISDKGVSVPVGSALDDCPTLISQIGGAFNKNYIGGRYYPSKVMPDGKEWTLKNLDLKICDIGGTGTPTASHAWYYDNDETLYGFSARGCGLLYNGDCKDFFVSNAIDVIPGWHIPSLLEWSNLFASLNNSLPSLKALDSNWFSGWNGTNLSEFNALPTGARDPTIFYDVGNITRFWASDNGYHFIKFDQNSYDLNASDSSEYSFSIRLVAD